MPYLTQILFNPVVFYFFLTALAALAALAVFSYLRLAKRQNQLFEDEKSKIQDYWQKQILDYSAKNSELSKNIELLTARTDEQARQIESLNKLEESLKVKEALRVEIAAKEGLKLELEDSQGKLMKVKDILDSKEKEHARMLNELKGALNLKEDELAALRLENDNAAGRLNNLQEQLSFSQNELKLAVEACADLKDKNLDFERQVDALSQALALEKALQQSPGNDKA